MEAAGGRVYVPRKDMDYAVTVGLRMLTLRRLVLDADGLFAANVAIWSLASLLLLSTFHKVRSARRRRRNLCTACGHYNGREVVSTEA